MTNINKTLGRWKKIIIITALIKLSLFILPAIITPTALNVSDPWVRWDGPHYIDIAKNGYQTTREQKLFIVFYPLYPLLINLTTIVLHDFVTSSIAISLFFSFVASIFLFELTLLDFNKRVALLAVWFLNISPTAFFLQASYTESLYLTLSLSTIYYYRKKKYLSASITGILSTMTKINGILLLPLLFLESKFILSYKKIITCLIILCGFLIYLLINFYYFGDFFYFTKPLYSNWYKKFELPWIGIDNLIRFTNTQIGNNYYIFWGEIISIIVIFLFTIFAYLKISNIYIS